MPTFSESVVGKLFSVFKRILQKRIVRWLCYIIVLAGTFLAGRCSEYSDIIGEAVTYATNVVVQHEDTITNLVGQLPDLTDQ